MTDSRIYARRLTFTSLGVLWVAVKRARPRNAFGRSLLVVAGYVAMPMVRP